MNYQQLYSIVKSFLMPYSLQNICLFTFIARVCYDLILRLRILMMVSIAVSLTSVAHMPFHFSEPHHSKPSLHSRSCFSAFIYLCTDDLLQIQKLNHHSIPYSLIRDKSWMHAIYRILNDVQTFRSTYVIRKTKQSNIGSNITHY